MTSPLAPDAWFNKKIQEGGGIFDRKSFDLMMSACKNFRVALDVGAHVGTWSIGMAQKFEQVWAIEPMDINYKYLIDNTKDITNIHTIQTAVGDGVWSNMRMAAGSQNSGQPHIVTGEEIAVQIIPMTTLDECFPEITHVDLLKIDVEGYELQVLHGGKSLIERCSPVIQVELNGLAKRYNGSDGAVSRHLESIGYKLFGRENKDYVYTRG